MKLLYIVLASIIISACSSTGSQMKLGKKQVVFLTNPSSPENSADIDSQANIYPINLATLSQLNQSHSSIASPLPASPSREKYQYRIGVGDVLSINDDLPTEKIKEGDDANKKDIWVNEQGFISYPLIGKVHVAGQTLPEIHALLTSKLKRYFRKPIINVAIKEFRSQLVRVSGQIKEEKSLTINDIPMTLLDAVNLSGGATDIANLREVSWTHQGKQQIVSLYDVMQNKNQAFNPILSSGDIVHVPSIADRQVYMLGEVGSQQTLSIRDEGLNLTAALAESRGISQNVADPSGVFVIRHNDQSNLSNKPISIYQLDLSDASAYVLGTQFHLKNQDIVYVTSAPISRWNRLISQIMPSLSAINIIKNQF